MQYKRISIFPYFLALIVFSITIYYGLGKYADLRVFHKGINANISLSGKLETALSPLDQEHKSAEDSAAETSVDKQEAINAILPDSEEITNLTRELDNFFVKYNASNEPLFLSNLGFGEPIINSAQDYAMLPIQMDIRASDTNFYRFLDYIENSGSYENKIRLMNIEQININFEAPMGQVLEGEIAANQGQKIINFSVKAMAYFQKPIQAGEKK